MPEANQEKIRLVNELVALMGVAPGRQALAFANLWRLPDEEITSMRDQLVKDHEEIRKALKEWLKPGVYEELYGSE